jgi:hypothetical protein
VSARPPSARPPGARAIEARLVALGDAADAAFLARYFKTGTGEYGAGDRFLGIRLPALRRLARELDDLPLRTVSALLRSRWHEVRLLALLVLVRAYERATRRGDPETRDRVYALYMSNLARVNNWDLVDLSAPNIVGTHLLGADLAPLRRLARSKHLWERPSTRRPAGCSARSATATGPRRRLSSRRAIGPCRARCCATRSKNSRSGCGAGISGARREVD